MTPDGKSRYLAKNAHFWPNLAVFGPKIQISMGEKGLFALFFDRARDQMDKKANILPKMPIFCFES